MAYWLMKSEPNCFSIDDLAARPDQTAGWDGVRNYQVRNMFRDQMRIGDQAFFYHSSCAVPGIVGIMRIVSDAYPDPTQFDPRADHYDPKSTPEHPRWLQVDVKFECKFARPVTLATLRAHQERLKGLQVLQPGNRLSVTPVREDHWHYILQLAS
ncbi:Predicted RNA-binding protein, contains PUA-like domain [Fontimonas thermophila]|uniref:Predicted RNA-binding protein, contains PUA-like domain n=1 Tax=Fontimonas thermophila TaxID=1076937 RepID=A0A1I2J0W8_9GAMM|nr:EVE domain-containing protein [Fontimonas thermophila]SFF48372.1 Predicted RNA-binding protein, contains PUA-like domain [Fontimonas thermophila]